jgi:hypothetical protein
MDGYRDSRTHIFSPNSPDHEPGPMNHGPDSVPSSMPRTFRIGGFAMPRAAGIFFAAFAASILFFLLGPYSSFAPAGDLDPWIYTGYFTHFSYLIQHYGVTYYASRLPWIVPGILAFKVATPAVASVILNALIMASSLTALYFIVAWHYENLPAILACIALMTNPYFVSSVAWDYPDGPAVAYAFLALACFLRPVQGFVPNSLLGGACMALSGYTNLAGLPVLLGILVIPLLRYRRSLGQLIRQSAQFILGGSIVTLVFAILSKRMLGRYMFFMPQIEMIKYTRDHPDYLKHMWGTGYAWIPLAHRLFPPLFILFLGAVLLLRRRKRNPVFVQAYLCLLVTSALFCLFEFQFNNVGLRVCYGTTYIIAPLFAFIGLLLGEYLSQCESLPDFSGFLAPRWQIPPAMLDKMSLGKILLWTVVALFGLALPFAYAQRGNIAITGRAIWQGMFVGGLATAAIMVVFKAKRVLPCAIVCCLILVGLFLGPAYDGALGYIWSKDNASVFQSITQIEGLVDAGIDPDRVVKFWYDPEEPVHPGAGVMQVRPSYFFDSAYSTYLWGYFNFTKDLPTAPLDEVKRQVTAKTTFVHLTVDTDRTPGRDRLLAARGIVVGNERRWMIPSGMGNLWVILQDVIDDKNLH